MSRKRAQRLGKVKESELKVTESELSSESNRTPASARCGSCNHRQAVRKCDHMSVTQSREVRKDLEHHWRHCLRVHLQYVRLAEVVVVQEDLHVPAPRKMRVRSGFPPLFL